MAINAKHQYQLRNAKWGMLTSEYKIKLIGIINNKEIRTPNPPETNPINNVSALKTFATFLYY